MANRIFRSSVTKYVHEAFFGEDRRGNLPTCEVGPKMIMLEDCSVWTVCVLALLPMPAGRRGKRSAHRFVAECSRCKQILSVGRIHQHVCKVTP